ncbi:MAG: NAD(P)-dependent oxidoreductase [Aigarchaeota archaeon]|nr:NAD(P)-dependent oxidoreductase [Candidatus Wolframiiraptor gerlachensis]
MKVAELLFPQGPLSSLEFRDKVLEVFRKAGLSSDLELGLITREHLEALAFFSLEELEPEERRRFFTLLAGLLEEEGNELYKIFEPKIIIRKSSDRRNFQEVVSGVDLRSAELEADRCLRCRVPKCVNVCPVKFPVPAFLKAVASGRHEAAYKISLAIYPTLGICGRICDGFCEQACTLGQICGNSLKIRAMKRAVADNMQKVSGLIDLPKPKSGSGFRVAVIGSGPAGLTAAYHLRLMGHDVTIFDAGERPGGRLADSIPEFRLPLQVVEREVGILRMLGVEFRMGVEFGRDLTIDDLFKQGYRAVFIATGAGRSNIPQMKGVELESVHAALEFLKLVKEGRLRSMSGKVWVIGGGNTAIDAARTALRLGAESVRIMYRRSMEEMPARREEIEEALDEGVEIMFLTQPIELIGEDGRLRKIRCIKMMLGERGPDGRRKPVPLEGSEFEVEADHVIFATGERPSTEWLSERDGIELMEDGRIKVNERLETSRRGVFAGGDVVRGPSLYSVASADGMRAAKEIDRYLRSLSS